MQLIDPQAPALTPKWQRFLAIWRHGIAIAQVEGAFIRIEKSPPVISWKQGGFQLLYRTPFQKLPRTPKVVAMGFPEPPPFGLDIWATLTTPPQFVPRHDKGGDAYEWQLPTEGLQKVFNTSWHTDGGAIKAASFRRGDWEQDFLAIAASVPKKA